MTTARQIQLRIAAHDQQNKFIQCAEPEQLFGGSKSGGKSIGLCQKAVLLSMEFPGNRGLLCRKDFTDLRDSLLVTFFRVCPEELIQEHNQSARTITLKNGSTILYRGMGDLHEKAELKGLEVGWFAIDEASEVPEENYLMLRAQLRWVLPDSTRPFYCALLASNPEPCWL